ncbi:MAG: hypothetical protein V2A54_13560 [Bacteroidota bacterium]
MSDFQLEPGETQLGKWTLNYKGPDGQAFLGPLIVTNTRLLFNAKYDQFESAGMAHGLKYTHGHIIIPKELISNVGVEKSFLKKKVIVSLDNGQQHIFDYGMLGIDKIVEAINAK